jgi:magnesium transporter
VAFHKRRPPLGARPGTLAIPKEAPAPRLFVFQYGPDGARQTEIEEPGELRDLHSGRGVLWLDIQGLGDEKLLRMIADEFQIHPLALEDAVNAPQRAKSEIYEKHQLVISRIPILSEDGKLSVPQVCFLIGSHYVITFQETCLGVFEPVRERIRAGIGPIRGAGPDYLAYALIDTMVDHYYPIAEQLSRKLDELDEIGTADPNLNIMPELHEIRRQLLILRRIGWPQREAVHSLIRDRTPFVSDEVRSYFRDTNDHISQIMELVDSTREMSNSLSETYLSNLGQRTNEVMKVLTVMASIFIPLTFIAGIYGMNFDNMPELHHPLGYLGAVLVMITIAIGMVLFFRHRGWLGGSPSRRSDKDG